MFYGESDTDQPDNWDWHAWRAEAEARIMACEASIRHIVALGERNVKESHTDALAALVDALSGPVDALVPPDPVDTVPLVEQPTPPLVEVVPSPVAGSITVDLTPVTGGVFGATPRGDGEQMNAAADAIIASGNVATKPNRKRAPRVTPTDAQLRVRQALTAAQSTIRGITAWEATHGWGIPLTSSQIRAALTAMEGRSEVHVTGKRGKQEVWALRS